MKQTREAIVDLLHNLEDKMEEVLQGLEKLEELILGSGDAEKATPTKKTKTAALAEEFGDDEWAGLDEEEEGGEPAAAAVAKDDWDDDWSEPPARPKSPPRKEGVKKPKTKR